MCRMYGCRMCVADCEACCALHKVRANKLVWWRINKGIKAIVAIMAVMPTKCTHNGHKTHQKRRNIK